MRSETKSKSKSNRNYGLLGGFLLVYRYILTLYQLHSMDEDRKHLFKAIADSSRSAFDKDAEVDEVDSIAIALARCYEPRDILRMAAGALEDGNYHKECAVLRRMMNGSLDTNAALAANELRTVTQEALDLLHEHMTDEDQEEGGIAHDTINSMVKVMNNADGTNQDWRYWENDSSKRV